MRPGTGTRAAFIVICAILMGSTIYVLGESVRGDRFGERASRQAPSAQALEREIAQEAEVFRLSGNALGIGAQPASTATGRTLGAYYRRRAYPGAPPVIPHPLKADMDREATSCLACHERGGFVVQWKAFAPVTPHPGFLSCRQCHVPAITEAVFRETRWQSVSPPSLKRSALPGSPPQIPHGLQMRENCIACHGGAAAPKEIRTSHPERVSCRQCHAAREADTVWIRQGPP